MVSLMSVRCLVFCVDGWCLSLQHDCHICASVGMLDLSGHEIARSRDAGSEKPPPSFAPSGGCCNTTVASAARWSRPSSGCPGCSGPSIMLLALRDPPPSLYRLAWWNLVLQNGREISERVDVLDIRGQYQQSSAPRNCWAGKVTHQHCCALDHTRS